MAEASTAHNEHGHCGCGHDHSHDHDHDHKQAVPAKHKHKPGIVCPTCGDHNLTDGSGHDRTMGRLSVALIGGFFIVNSFVLEWLVPDQMFSAKFSAIIGSVILAFPIMVTALKDIYYGKIYMNELVALAILAAFAGADFQTAGIISFFLLLTIIIESRTASGAQRSIEELIKLTPNTARKIVNGSEVDVEALDLKIGDVIREHCKPGIHHRGIAAGGQRSE